MATPLLRDWLAEAPYGLCLSSGFFGFFAHAGVLTALLDAGLAPARLSGSSAGALVCGGYAAGVDPPTFQAEMLKVKKSDFWDPGLGFGLLKGRRFHALLETMLPVHEIENGRLPLSISVFDVWGFRTRVLETGDLVSAIRASCAVPLMFHPVWIDRRPYLDGGARDRPGWAGMPADMRTLYHHLPAGRDYFDDPAKVPRRDGAMRLQMRNLPRSGPDDLDKAPACFDAGYRGAKAALDRPADPAAVIVVDV